MTKFSNAKQNFKTYLTHPTKILDTEICYFSLDLYDQIPNESELRCLTGRVLAVDEGSIFFLQLHPDSAAKLEFEASLSRILLVLDDRREPGGDQHVPDFKDVRVGKTLIFWQESTL